MRIRVFEFAMLWELSVPYAISVLYIAWAIRYLSTDATRYLSTAHRAGRLRHIRYLSTGDRIGGA
eukprot:3379083-Rhodomonas_salina.3